MQVTVVGTSGRPFVYLYGIYVILALMSDAEALISDGSRSLSMLEEGKCREAQFKNKRACLEHSCG